MTKRKPPGYWMKEENVIAEAIRVMEEQSWDTLPPHNQLRKNGYNSLRHSIHTYYEGMPAFRSKLGQKKHNKTKRILGKRRKRHQRSTTNNARTRMGHTTLSRRT